VYRIGPALWNALEDIYRRFMSLCAVFKAKTLCSDASARKTR
jgi:hypothetical protein